MEDIINHSRRPKQSRTNEKINFDENEQQEHDNEPIGVLDFSLKFDEINKQSNRSRSINTIGKSRSLKRKHPNGSTDNNNGITRIFHADAFCGICRKVKNFFFDHRFRNFFV